jgi:hypothetical protein
MLEEGIVAAIQGDASLNAVIAERITPFILPKNPTLPAVTFFTVVDSNDVNLDKTATTKTDVQVDFWAKTYLEAKQGRKLLTDLFDGFTGQLPDGTYVREVVSHSNPDFYEKDSLLYRSSTTFTFMT